MQNLPWFKKGAVWNILLSEVPDLSSPKYI